MPAETGLRIVALLVGGAACLVACRGVLGIDDDRPALVSPEAAPVEAGPGEEAGLSPNAYCSTLAPPAQRCADFEADDLFAGWDNAGKTPNPGLVGGGSFAELLEPDGRKLLARTPALVATDQHAYATLQYTLPSLAPRISIRAKLKVVTENIPGPTELVIMSLVFGDEGAVVIYRDKDGPAIAVVPDGKAARIPSWPVGSSRTIGIVVTTGANAFARGSIESEYGPELALPAHFANAKRPRVAIGPSVDAPMGEVALTIDDVAMYWGAAE
jgi:hypothetical protein